eukprot:14769789-Alexandrium_andersonii.AAC.1
MQACSFPPRPPPASICACTSVCRSQKGRSSEGALACKRCSPLPPATSWPSNASGKVRPKLSSDKEVTALLVANLGRSKWEAIVATQR